jgi:hypothetical protein
MPPTLTCVIDDVPEVSSRLLREACARRGVGFAAVDATTFDFDPARRLGPGAMLVRLGASLQTIRVEQFLHGPGVATFYRTPDGINLDTTTPSLMLERGGVPVPKTLYCATSDRVVLRGYAARLGGCPLVAKVEGHEGGQGVYLLDSLDALFSFADLGRRQGIPFALVEYIRDATHWRVVIVGERAVAAYLNPPRPGDFRTLPSDDPSDYTYDVALDLAAPALAATMTLGVAFAGVDLLRAADGRIVVLEVNSPCYYPQAQEVGGIDVAGAMVEWLAERARGVISAARHRVLMAPTHS